MQVAVKGRYTIIGKVDAGEEALEAHLTVTTPAGRVDVLILSDGTSVESVLITDVSDATLSGLRAGLAHEALSEEAQTELRDLVHHLVTAARRVVELLKYALQNIEIDDALISTRGEEWRTLTEGDADWKPLPGGAGHSVMFDFRVTRPLGPSTIRQLQHYIDSDFQPFVALRHLHRARRDPRPWARWIDATIAAELAIKEYLLRKQPHLNALLLEVPSPSLRVLYGRVLTAYAGWRSSYVAQLDKGAAKRNEILHRPQVATVSSEDAAEYVQIVTRAIFELLADLHPSDTNICRYAGPLSVKDAAKTQ
jgi:glutathione S-transferase